MFKKIWLHPMESHNPYYDILCGRIDADTYITYCLQIKGPTPGKETMEIYTGENYNADSKLRSWSRHYSGEAIPKTWKKHWLELQRIYKMAHSRQ
jgi:hypothetical protein